MIRSVAVSVPSVRAVFGLIDRKESVVVARPLSKNNSENRYLGEKRIRKRYSLSALRVSSRGMIFTSSLPSRGMYISEAKGLVFFL
jgi:hypothetical protein